MSGLRLAWELVPGRKGTDLGEVLYPTLRESSIHIDGGGDVAINLDRTRPPLIVLRIRERYGAGEFVYELGRRGAVVVRRHDQSWDVFVPSVEGVGPGLVAARFGGDDFEVEVVASGRVVIPVISLEYRKSSAYVLGDRILWVKGKSVEGDCVDVRDALTALEKLSALAPALSLVSTLSIK